ncbi:MAG: sulfatase-like hydrolase/transferase, partial [Planctomycetes bacterium]|nr:sulfatase-like hydrolase/transferase [Planctomycetota bacterium]
MNKHKHILWIYSDELRADSLSCYGGPAGLTPHLDRLAEQGVRYDQSWCSSPVCVPSRVSALTALPATKTGIYHNEAAWGNFTYHNPPQSWVTDFAEAGYRTVNVGKIHVAKGLHTFAEDYTANGDMGGILNAIDKQELNIITPPGVSTSIGGRWPKGQAFPPEEVTRTTIDILKNTGDKALLLRASYLQPHTPVTPPEELIKAWDHLPIETKYHLAHGPSQFEKKMEENIQSHHMDIQKAKECWIAYHALVHWLDIQVGALLDALEENGLSDDTLILFTADHGASLGEKGLWAKQSFSRGSHQVPMIIRQPDGPSAVNDNTLCNG